MRLQVTLESKNKQVIQWGSLNKVLWQDRPACRSGSVTFDEDLYEGPN